MILIDEDRYLLETALEVFDNTHSYDNELCGELCDEIKEVLSNDDGSNILSLLIDCKHLLDDTHCYDMGIFEEIGDRINTLK